MSQFKVGDRVVMYTCSTTPFSGVVTEVDDRNDVQVIRDDNGTLSYHYSYYAMLEYIYNSPLYKALS